MKGMCLLYLFKREMWRKKKEKGLETWWTVDQCWHQLMFGVSSHGYHFEYSELRNEKSPQALVSCWHDT